MFALSGMEKLGITLALVLAGMVVLFLVKQRLAKRTIAAWAGVGANRDLAPHEAAVLLGLNPSVVVAILAEELRLRGRAQAVAEPHEPCRIEWSGGDPDGPVEKALLDSLDGSGELRPEGVIHLVETIYDEVNEKMIPFSGRATAVYYRDFADRLWNEEIAAATEVRGSSPFFLLHDPDHDSWDDLGDDPVSRRLRRAVAIAARFRDHLVPQERYVERARQARSGYFRYRRDLTKVHGRLTSGTEAELLTNWRYDD